MGPAPPSFLRAASPRLSIDSQSHLSQMYLTQEYPITMTLCRYLIRLNERLSNDFSPFLNQQPQLLAHTFGRKRMIARWPFLFAFFFLMGCPIDLEETIIEAGPNTLGPNENPLVLIFTKTKGYRHRSIEIGVRSIKELGQQGGFTAVHSENSSVFHRAGLRKFQAVIFLNTTGDILNPSEQVAFEQWYRAGGGFFGVHAAADTEYNWSFYGDLLGGAYFKSHPPVQKATILVENRDFPATHMLPFHWPRVDEWYTFRRSPEKAPGTVVLARLTKNNAKDGTLNPAQPIAWYREVYGGRALYTGGGHTIDSYTDPLFRAHLKEGIRWVARAHQSVMGTQTKGKATQAGNNSVHELESMKQHH